MRFLPFLLGAGAILLSADFAGHWLLATYVPLEGAAHHVMHFVVDLLIAAPFLFFLVFRPLVAREVEAKVRAEAQLAARFLDVAPAIVIVMDRSGKVVRFSREAARVSGYSVEETLGREVWFLIPTDQREGVRQVFRNLTAGDFPNRHENAWLTKNGELRWIRWRNTCETDAIGRVRHVIATGVDVTEQREQERQLRLLRAGIEQSGEVVFLTDTEGHILFVNPTFQALYGYSFAEVAGRTPRVLKSGEHAKDVYEYFWDTILAGKSIAGEVINRCKDGRLVTVESAVNPVEDDDGNTVAFLAIQRDVSARKQMEVALRQSEERFRTLLERIPDGVALADRTRVIRYANPALCALLERTSDRLVGADLMDSVTVEERAAVSQAVESVAVASGDSNADELVETYLVAGGGALCPVEMRLRRVQLEGEESLLCIVRDLSEEHRLQEHLRQAQKMEAVGQLAGGVAHDFNNLLTIVQGNIDLLVEQLGGDRPQELVEAADAVDRGKDLVSRLLSFSRKDQVGFQAVDPGELLLVLEGALRRLVPESISLAIDVEPELPRIRAHPSSLEQVIFNLVTNARDAMPDGGALRIAARIVGEPPEDVPVPSPGRPHVRIDVVDNGAGIPEAMRERIFDPFFTTKPVGKGTGLGLSMAYGLMRQHKGAIKLTSKVGEGTCVSLFFPVTTSDGSGPTPGKSPATKLDELGGTETILFVEDEPAVRRAAARNLTSLGYHVIEAADGAEALELLRQRGQDIDLVVTDLVMPNMGGRELESRARSMLPDLPFIFCSGYERDRPSTAGGDVPEIPFLQKPWKRLELATIVRNNLGRASGD